MVVMPKSKRRKPKILPISQVFNLCVGDKVEIVDGDRVLAERVLTINSNGYLCFSVNSFKYLYHRCLFFNEFMSSKEKYHENKDKIVHHLDGDKLNNSQDNLVLISRVDLKDIYNFISECPYCGRRFVKTYPAMKYCCPDCRDKAKEDQDIIHSRTHYNRYVKAYKYSQNYRVGSSNELTNDSIVKCIDCGSRNISYDSGHDEYYCRDCGTVIYQGFNYY
jgi:predicted RNA-binding Zn-ribbon protein involved in translation (DUF1610 family)